MRYLLDTNVISETTRVKPDPRVLDWLLRHGFSAFVSSLSMGELWKGIRLIPNEDKRERFVRWYEEQAENFSGQVLVPDMEVMTTWGTYCAEQIQAGSRPPVLDSLLAATALTHRLTVATRNERDFPGVPTVNPWLE